MTTQNPCQTARRLMLLADTGELDGAQRADLDRHLAACPACRRIHSIDLKIVATTRKMRPRPAPALSVAALEKKARRNLLVFRASSILAAVAALLLALLGANQWLLPLSEESAGSPAPARHELLDEWQFWMVSTVGQQSGAESAGDFMEGWTEGDLARHLLVLEGLLPEEEADFEEDGGDATSGALPPISLRDYNSPGLLRS